MPERSHGRRWLLAAVASMAVVAAVAFWPSSGSTAPGARVHWTERNSPLPGSPFGNVLGFATAGPDTSYALTDAEASCSRCSTLWRWTTAKQRWQRVHDFFDPPAGAVNEVPETPPVASHPITMAADGRGFLVLVDGNLSHTTDGGTTWRTTDGPRDGSLFLTDGAAWRADTDGLWRASAGTGAWSRVEIPTASEGIGHLAANGDLVTYTTLAPTKEQIVRSTDGGATWRAVDTQPTPCEGCVGPCTALSDGVGILVETCLSPDDAYRTVVRRTTDGRRWTDWHLLPDYSETPTEVRVVDDSHLLVVGAEEAEVIDAAGSRTHSNLRFEEPASIDDAAFLPGGVGHLLTLDHQLWRTEDGARTWRVIG